MDHGLTVNRNLIDLDHRVLSAPGIFDGVGQKVRESLLQQPWVAIDSGQRTNMPLDFSSIDFRFKVLEDVLYERIQLRHLRNSLAAIQTGQVEQITYHKVHFLRTLLNEFQKFLSLWPQLGTVFRYQHVRKPADV